MPAALVAALKKISISLGSSDEGRKLIYFLLLLPFLLIFVIVSVVNVLFSSVPTVEAEHVSDIYLVAVQNIENETKTLKDGSVIGDEGIVIDYIKLVSIDAITHEQDFDKANIQSVTNVAKYFIYEEEEEEIETIEKTCVREIETIDEEGNEVIVEETYDCSYDVTVIYTYYYERDLEKVVQIMKDENRISHSAMNDILHMYYFTSVERFSDEYAPVIIGSKEWVWPTVSTRITSSFGIREAPCRKCTSYHAGTDIGAVTPGKAGDPVWAIDSGTVITTEYSSAAGNYIVIDHGDDIYSRYLHLHNVEVNAGMDVNKGDLIGIMGGSGFGTGVHLHFEILKNEQAVNAMSYYR